MVHKYFICKSWLSSLHFWHKFISCYEELVYYCIHFILLEKKLLWANNLKSVLLFLPVYLIIHWLLALNFFLFFFLLSQTTHFDKSIFLSYLVLKTFGILLSAFFLHFKQYDNMVLYIV